MTGIRQMLMALWLLAPAAMQATDYYAAPNGTGDGLKKETAGDVNTLRNKLKPGDTLYLLGGQYDFTTTLNFGKGGEADNMVTICAYEGEQPVFDFRNEPNKTNGVTLKADYVHIKDLTIRYAGYKGIWVEGGKHNILEHLDVYGCCNAGIQLRSGGYNTVVNCDSHDNFDYQDDGGNADGFADKQGDACPGNVYIGCRSWNNSDDGWDSFQRVTSGTPTVYINCIAYNNGPATYDLTGHPRVEGIDADLSCFAGKDLTNFANGGNPNGFKVGGKGTEHNVELYRCLAIGHRSKGFDQNNNAGAMKIVNCTAYDNQINYGFGNDYAYALALVNNVSLLPRQSHVKTSSRGTVTEQNNTWGSGFAVSADDFESLDVEGLLLKDRQAGGSLPTTLLLRLKADSKLIDAGVKYIDFSGDQIMDYVSYNGSAPDLGCYETESQTAIDQLTVSDGQPSPLMPMYNLKGQRVDGSYRGVVIQSGQKYLVR